MLPSHAIYAEFRIEIQKDQTALRLLPTQIGVASSFVAAS
jgi:hypothetical protein